MPMHALHYMTYSVCIRFDLQLAIFELVYISLVVLFRATAMKKRSKKNPIRIAIECSSKKVLPHVCSSNNNQMKRNIIKKHNNEERHYFFPSHSAMCYLLFSLDWFNTGLGN